MVAAPSAERSLLEALMRYHEDSGVKGIIVLTVCGVLASGTVLFSIYNFSQQTQNDQFFASEENLAFQKTMAVKNIRREIAEQFVTAVLSCISQPILPGQSLTKEEANERVRIAIERLNLDTTNQRCYNNKSAYWTFEFPCKLKINNSSYKLVGDIQLGDIGDISICTATISDSIRSTINRCSKSNNFQACLVSSVLANDDIKNEIDKPD